MRKVGYWPMLAVAAVAATIPQAATAQQAKAKRAGATQELSGTLADGTPFLLRKPANWNGIVVSDLDGVRRKNGAFYRRLLKAGYGTAGADRRSDDRNWTLNRHDDVRRPQIALALFRKQFGEPKLSIAFGRSAGGASALLAAEHYPQAVDGAVALCASMDFLGHANTNLIFDFFYTLKTLIAPNDERLLTHALPPRGGKAVLDHWHAVLKQAAATPEGRARIALAFTIAQYPIYAQESADAPMARVDVTDTDAVTAAMLQTLPKLINRLKLLRVYDAQDFPADLQIPGTPQAQIADNDGAIYADYWQNGEPAIKQVTEALYQQAGIDIAHDLRTLDNAPRVTVEPAQLQQAVLGRGQLTRPVLRIDNLGDVTAPPNAALLYDSLVALHKAQPLYRTAYVDNSAHCKFTPAQEFAAVEVMRERLESDAWPATDAAALNARSGSDDSGDGRIFVEQQFRPFNASWRLARHRALLSPGSGKP